MNFIVIFLYVLAIINCIFLLTFLCFCFHGILNDSFAFTCTCTCFHNTYLLVFINTEY
jgi:hypothetical protein